MVRRCGLLLILILTLAITGMVSAQDSEKKSEKGAVASAAPKDPWSFYKLDLTVREMDGSKTVNSRTYAITQRSGEWGQLRVGSQVPSLNSYIDIGLNLDCRVQDRDDATAFDWRIEMSSLGSEPSGNNPPVIRQVRNNGQTLLSMGKPIVMASVDDLSSTHKFVFEVTATKLK